MKKVDKYPKYSVLMSVYYKEKPEVLKETLKSIAEQTILCNELVLVEDGKLTEALYETIDEFNQMHPKLLKIVKLNKNVGLGLALREGILHCSNELIARFDSDDISVINRCEKQLEEFRKDEELGIVGSNHIEFVENINNKSSYTYKDLPCSDEEIKKYARRRNPFSHSVVMYKKSMVLKAGNYRNYYYVEDYDLWVRMIQNGCKCKNINEYLSYVRVSKDLYKRRGGIKYLKSILKFKKELYKNGFYSFSDYIISTSSHILVCMMPGSLRQFIYKKMLRK